MAKDTNLELEDGSKNKKKLIIIFAAVILTVVSAACYFVFFDNTDNDTSDDQSAIATVSNSVDVERGNAFYVAMPRPFVFNVPGAVRDRYVQIKVQLLVRGEVNEETAKKHIPLIKGTLLGIFTASTAEELSTSEGKEALRAAALEKVQAAMADVAGSKVIERVLFTGFVMQ